ncbi:protoglobin domain-containing protein [Pinisolibacter sp.]|uniref:protoglobin domain-containing protein n=1 Tax=Pinisolibacter sp. TaxID=2172024 RepID=UPI002FDE4177
MKAEIMEMTDCIGLKEADTAVARKYGKLIGDALPRVIDDFYGHLFSIGYEKFFRDVNIDRLKAHQLDHWRRLFEVEIDKVHTTHMTRIGVVHRDRDVTPKVYMQSYGWFTSRLVDEITRLPGVDPTERAPLAAAVLKLIFLDMTMALASYDAALID